MKKQITTKNQIMDCLQWSSEEYDDRLFNAIWNWCHLHGQYPSIIQQLLANAKINRWFIKEHQKLEFQFLKMVEAAPNNPIVLLGYYKGCTAQIFKNWPSALMENLKRNRDFSQDILKQPSVTPIIYYAN